MELLGPKFSLYVQLILAVLTDVQLLSTLYLVKEKVSMIKYNGAWQFYFNPWEQFIFYS
jgi:hypothetical protein